MDITLPNGYVLTGVPDGTNKWAIAEKAIKAGLAKPEDFGQQSADPTAGMSGFEKFRAGYGKAAVDLARGAGQAVGLVNRQDVANSRALDAPLMKTGAGKAGDIAGTIADLLPTAAIPGANTLAGAAAIGGGTGFLMPSASTKETLMNTGVGAVVAPATMLAARGIGAAYRGGKALLEPFTQGGQEAIAGRTLNAAAGGSGAAQNIDDALLGQTLGITPKLEGVQPTTAELANNAGLSQLNRTLANNPEFSNQFVQRAQENKSAIMSALDSIAGDTSKRSAAVTAREGATEALYKSAGQTMVKPDAELVSLLQRPSMSQAIDRAANLAAEAGQTIPKSMNNGLSGDTLHYIKMAMDDLADNPAISGIGKNEARAIAGTRNALVKWMGKNIPEYDLARNTYASMSQPINQMDIGQALRDKLQPALADYGANSRMRAAQFAEALRNGDNIAANTTGFGGAQLAKIMSPEQMATLNQVAEQLGRSANATELGRAAGSNTAQNLVGQNFVRQLVGPLGVPQSMQNKMAQSTLAQTLLKPAQILGTVGEQRIKDTLARAMLDPAFASELMKRGITQQQAAAILAQRLAGPAAGGAIAAQQ